MASAKFYYFLPFFYPDADERNGENSKGENLRD